MSKKKAAVMEWAAKEIEKLAYSEDTWMTPSGDAPKSRQSRKDFGAYADEETSGWEETTHFQTVYLPKLIEIAERIGKAEKIDRFKDGESWYEECLLPVKEEFWEHWLTRHHVAECWENDWRGLYAKCA